MRLTWLGFWVATGVVVALFALQIAVILVQPAHVPITCSAGFVPVERPGNVWACDRAEVSPTVVVSCPAGTVWIAEINGVLSCVQEGKQP